MYQTILINIEYILNYYIQAFFDFFFICFFDEFVVFPHNKYTH